MRLAALDIPAAADAQLYAVAANRRVIASLNLCNRAAAVAKVRVALTAGAAPTPADWLEWDTALPAAGGSGGSTLERTGIAMAAGDRLYVRSDNAGVSAVLFGLAEPV